MAFDTLEEGNIHHSQTPLIVAVKSPHNNKCPGLLLYGEKPSNQHARESNTRLL